MRSVRLRGGFAVLFLALLNPALRAQDYVITQAPLGFTSISTTGVNQGANFSDKDDGELNIPIPFNFQFFGSNIVAGTNMLRLGANGAASFQTAVNIGITSSALSSSSAPNNTIFLAWDDLNFTTSGSIFTALQGTAPNRVWIIEYRMVPPFSAGGTFLDGQIAIFETSNIIEFRYSAATVFGSGTVASGLKSSTGLARGFPGITRGQPTPTSNLVFIPDNLLVDLALSNLIVTTPMTPGLADVGDSITISVDVTNLSPLANSTSFPVNVYLSSDSTIDTSDQLLGSFGSGTQLNAGAMANLSQSFTLPTPSVATPGGNYFIGLLADPTNTQFEVDKANNRASSPLTIGGASFVDLELSNLLVTTPTTPGQVAVGNSITISVDVTNLSPLANSTNFPVNVYLSSDSTIDTSDQLLGSFGSGTQLNAGAMANLSQSFTLPTPSVIAPGGNYFIGLIADPTNTQFEVNTANNRASSPLSFSFVDLELSNLLVTTPTTPGQVLIGDNITVSVDVRNLSPLANSTSFPVNVYLSPDSTIDTSDQLLGSFGSGTQLNAGAMANLSQSFTVPTPNVIAPGGNYFIGLLADPTNTQFEVNAANNRVSSPLPFSFVDLELFNLLVTTPTTPGQVLIGDSITISVDVRNLSLLANSTSFPINVYLSPDSTIDTSDQLLGSFGSGTQLNAGAMANLSQSFTVPTPSVTTPGGNYFIGLIADPTNTQFEVNTGNNRASSPLTVPTPQDYRITQTPLGFTSISTTGVNQGANFSNKDEGHLNVPIPFNFQFFGSNIVAGTNMLRLGANGAASFQTAVNIGFTSASLSSSSAPNNTIFLAWDDLDFSNSGSIFTALQGNAPNRVWIIEYRMVPPYTGPGNIGTQTFLDGQIAIFETSNIIEFRYSAATVFGSGTVASGLKSSTGLARGFPGITRGQPRPTSNLVFTPDHPIDLELSNLLVTTPTTPGQVLVGDSITVSVDIRNLSFPANSTSFPVNVYISLDSTIDTSDQLLGSLGSGTQLNAGAMANLSQTFTVPTPSVTTPGGNYFIGLIADPSNTQFEVNTANNRASSPLTIGSASLVDLALSNFLVTTPTTPGQVLIGDSITISFDIFNLSKFTSSTNFPVNVYLSLDSTIDPNDQLIGSFTGGIQLDAGAMASPSQNFVIPAPNPTAPGGNYFIGLIADPTNTQFEAITANNRVSSPLSLDTASFVDLAVSNLIVTTPTIPGQVAVGDSITVSVDIRNLSPLANSTNFPVNVYLSLDSTIDPNDQLIGSFTGGIQLDAGAMASPSQIFVIPAPNPTALSGNYFIGLIADPSNSQIDSNLANNRVSGPLTFDSASFLDLAVSNLVVTTATIPGQVAVGDIVAVSIDINNLSALKNSTNFPVNVYISPDSTIDSNDQLIDSFTGGIQLDAGATTSRIQSFVIPAPNAPAPGGNYFIGLLADPSNSQVDSNLENNRASSPLTFNFVDLALSNLVVTTPTTPAAVGDIITVSVDVRNLSSLKNSTNFRVDVFLSPDSTIDFNDRFIGSFTGSIQLDAGAMTSRSQDFVILAPLSPTPGGNYFIGLIADSSNSQVDLNLSNNQVSSPLNVDPASLVDLAVSNFVVTTPTTPGQVALGDSISISFDVSNLSPLTDSQSFPVDVYLSPDSTITTADQLIFSFSSSFQLNAGATTSRTQSFVIPAPTSPAPGGNYFIGVRANSPIFQFELNLANNAVSSPLSFDPASFVDLAVSNLVITGPSTPGRVAVGDSITVSVDITNLSPLVNSTIFPVSVYLSPDSTISTNDQLIGPFAGGIQLNAGAMTSLSQSLVIPTPNPLTPDGNYFIGVLAGPLSSQADLNPANNSAGLEILVASGLQTQDYVITQAPLGFTSISTTGVNQGANFSSKDEGELNIPIPFNFQFFGGNIVAGTNLLRLGANGAASFQTAVNISRFSESLSSSSAPNNTIFLAWDDLDFSSSGSIYTALQGTAPNRVWIIEYSMIPPFSGTTFLDGQIAIFETSNIIEFRYSAATVFRSGTVASGLKSSTGLARGFPGISGGQPTPTSNLVFTPVDTIDLALSNFVVTTPMTPGQVAIGDTITISVDITNLAPLGDSTSFPVNVYLSTDSIISTNDQLIGSLGSGIQLDAGAMTNLSQSFTIPAPNTTTPGGNYFIGLISDPFNSQADVLTANNRASQPLTFNVVELALSNFVVTTPMTPGQVAIGDSISVSVDINNLSPSVNSTNFPVNVYLSTDSIISTNDQLIGSLGSGTQLDAGAMTNLSQSFTIPAPNTTTPGGNYFIGLIADPANSQVDSNLANNRVSGPLTFDSASFLDLAVSNFVVTTPTIPGQVLTGDSLTISVDISNLSSLRNSTNFQVLVYLSLDSTIDFIDQIIGSFTGGVQLDAGAMTSRTQSFVIPAPFSPAPGGNYFVGLIADAFNFQLESNLANNRVSSPLSFGRVDLAASNLVITTPTTPGQVAVGNVITVSVDINNLSPLKNSTNFPVNVYLSPDSTIDTSDQLLGSLGSGTQLNAGAMANLSQSFTVPTPSVATPGGNYFIGLIADPANTQLELNTLNNKISSLLTFSFVELALSNFVVTTPMTPGQADVGDSISVSVDINNLSALKNSTNFPVNVYLSLDSAIQPSDQLIGSFTGGAQINAGGMTNLSQSFIIPTPSFPSSNGHYFVGLIADPLNTQLDTNLANNSSAPMPILVGAQFFSVNLTVSNLQVLTPQRPGNALAGDSILVSVDISNPFFVDSTNFPVNVYLSLDSTIDTNDQLVGSFTGGAQVNASGSVSLSESFILPTPNPSATSHRYRIGVIADPANTQADRGLSDNNVASTPFLIGSPYSVTTQTRGAFPTILGNANTVTLRDGATTVMDEGELLRPGGAPFAFPFFGDMIAPGTPVNIGFNGYLVIGSGGTPGGFNNPPIPSNGAPNGFIAAFWDDLVSNTSGEENTTGSLPKGKLSELVAGRAPDRTWTVEFTNFGRYQTNGTNLSFQIVIHESGIINLRYDSSSTFVGTASGFGATIGLENSTGTDGVDATGLGTNNLSFPSKDLLLFPPGGPYSVTTQTRGVFPTILGMPNTVTLRDGATTVMDEGELLRPGGAPFAFPFFGDMIAPGTPVNIGFNGYLVIGSGGTSAGFENLPIPSNQAPDGFIAAFWDDLVSNTSGEDNTAGNLPKGKLSELVAGSAPFRSWTIEFTNFGRFQTNGTNLSFQIVIHESGVINLRYDSSSTFVGTASGFGATIGVEKSTGTDGVDATGLGTGNLSFPSKDLFLSPPGAALPAPTPDLNASAISLAQSSVSAGARIDVTRIITNSSSAAVTSSFQVSIYLSTDSTITTSDLLLGTDTIASLAAGTSASATSSFTIPSATPVGDYFVGIIVNTGPNPVSESNTLNNSLATSGPIQIDLPSKFRGDINGDNAVDISDLMACISVALAADSGSPANITLADVNGDNSVDILDIQFTINRILGAP
jgi:subtilase family serine protease